MTTQKPPQTSTPARRTSEPKPATPAISRRPPGPDLAGGDRPTTTREHDNRGRPPELTNPCGEPEPRHHKGPSPTHRAAPGLGRTQGRHRRDQSTPPIRISHSILPHAADARPPAVVAAPPRCRPTQMTRAIQHRAREGGGPLQPELIGLCPPARGGGCEGREAQGGRRSWAWVSPRRRRGRGSHTN